MRVFILVLLSVSSAGLAQVSPATQPDPLAESKRVDAEIAKLQDTPLGKKMEALLKKQSAARERFDKEYEPLEKKLQSLQESDEGQRYQEKLSELETQRHSEWERERKILAEGAKRLYQARHEELVRLRAAALPEARALGLDVLSFPRVDGSTSTHPLSVVLASRVLGVPYEWAYPEPTGSWWRSRAHLEEEAYLRDGMPSPYRDPEYDEFTLVAARTYAAPSPTDGRQDRTAKLINSMLAGSAGTHQAYVNLIEGKCDLNLTARGPSASESKMARDKGVQLKLVPVAQDALVFMVNTRNPVASLSSEQLRAIYKNKITDWKQVGVIIPQQKKDGDSKIRAYWRERDSGSRELFEALLMKGEVQDDPKGERRRMLLSSGMGGPFSRLTGDSNGLAYSVYYYEHFMALSLYTRKIAVDGAEPTYETIASGRYPLTTPVYVACRVNQPADSPAMRLLAWLHTAEGRAVIRESGYVPYLPPK